jgi:hypothetical protein
MEHFPLNFHSFLSKFKVCGQVSCRLRTHICNFVYSLFEDAFNSSYYVMPNNVTL